MTSDNAEIEGNRYRYWKRIAKGCALPLLYTIVSLLMLRNYAREFPNYYDYKIVFIVLGVVLGLLTMTGLTLLNMFRARGKPKKGVVLEGRTVLVIYVPIFVLIIAIALFMGISTVWQMSIGFFATAIVSPTLVVLLELAFQGQFLIVEKPGSSKEKRLIFATNPQG